MTDEIRDLLGRYATGALSDEEKKLCGISDDMVRLSIGLEDIEDILWDLDQALSEAAKA